MYHVKHTLKMGKALERYFVEEFLKRTNAAA